MMSKANRLVQSKDPSELSLCTLYQGIFEALWITTTMREFLLKPKISWSARDPSTPTCRSLSERQAFAQDDNLR
jgi:hypothetical protein